MTRQDVIELGEEEALVVCLWVVWAENTKAISKQSNKKQDNSFRFHKIDVVNSLETHKSLG